MPMSQSAWWTLLNSHPQTTERQIEITSFIYFFTFLHLNNSGGWKTSATFLEAANIHVKINVELHVENNVEHHVELRVEFQVEIWV